MANRPRMPEKDRLLSHVSVAASGCWLWTAYVMKNGYGLFRTPARHELAHRAAYRIFKSLPPEGMDVMHVCDTPACVNPEHLSVGTRADNMQDCKNKGRNAAGVRHGRSKLTDAQVLEIRACSGEQKAIGKMFGVSQTTISTIRNARGWAHI